MKDYQNEETRLFLEEREKRFGGKITWRGFSLFYGDSSLNIRERGVFVFKIGDRIYFEDFEPAPKFLGMSVPAKNKSEYVKFESSFAISDVAEFYYVKKSQALSYAKGKANSLKKVSALTKFFNECVLMVKFKDGSVKFFEFAGREFTEEIK